jgi:energy-coupling factor transport system substrate-specific component
MIVLTSVAAALYAAAYVALSPFTVTLIPGVLVFTFRDLFDLLFGILFGPAGAWGVGTGNLIGDFLTGNLGTGSGFGFLANFLTAYLGYTLWTRYGAPARETASDSTFERNRNIAVYLGIGVITACVAATVLAWGLNLLGLAPFKIVATTLFLNLIAGNWVGGWLYVLLFRRVDALGVSWTSIMTERDTRKGFGLLGATLVSVGGGGGLVSGLFLVGSGALTPVVGIFCGIIIVGALCL